jgi:hypothetical protein
LITKQAHEPDVFGYQYRAVVLREARGNGRFAGSGFTAEEVKS